MRFLIAILVLLLLLIATSARAGEIHTRDGKIYQGEIHFLDTGKISILHDGQTTSLDMSEIADVLISQAPKPSGPHGLLGHYYQDRDCKDLRAQRLDPVVDFRWPSGQGVADGIVGDAFSVQWTGQVVPRLTERYTFSTSSDSGVQLSVNGTQIIDTWHKGHGGLAQGDIALEAGKHYDILLEYQNAGGNDTIHLFWTSPHQTQEIVPTDCLFAPSGGEDGTGLRALFLTQANPQGGRNRPAVIRFDKTVHLSGPPDPVFPGNFTARWSGTIKPRYDGLYTFYVHAVGGVRLRIADAPIIDSMNPQAPVDRSATINLQAGQKVNILLEYSHTDGQAAIDLEWSCGDKQKREVVPMGCLYPEYRRINNNVAQAALPVVNPIPALAQGIILTDGSIIQAVPTEIEPHGTVKLHWGQKDLSLPADRIAAVFQDRNVGEADWEWPAERGVVLRNGDFVEGSIPLFKDGAVRVSSVILGLKDYSLTDLSAVLLRKPGSAVAHITARCVDGSVYAADTVTFKNNALIIAPDGLGQITLLPAQIYSITSKK